MAGFDNEVMYARGERLEASSAQDVTLMQQLSTDIARINNTGNPNGSIAANPASLCHDPTTGIVWNKASGTGNIGWTSNLMVIPGPSIDLLTTGPTTLFTPETDFMVTGIIYYGVDVTGLTAPYTASIGNNSPTFDNLFSSAPLSTVFNTGEAAQTSQTPFTSAGGWQISAGLPLTFNVTVGGMATTYTQRVDIIGYYVG